MTLSRTTDPHTSHAAAAEAERTGRAQRQRDICLNEVLAHPEQTAAEIAQATGLERHVPSRRLPELRDAGLVHNPSTRICNVTGRKSLIWSPVKGEPAK